MLTVENVTLTVLPFGGDTSGDCGVAPWGTVSASATVGWLLSVVIQ
jgi:hypothetical protein